MAHSALLILFTLLSLTPPPSAESLRSPLVDELAVEFAARLEDPETYRKLVSRECRGFPEGDLFPYLLPLHAFAGMAEEGRMEVERALALAERLLDLARPVVAARLQAPDRDLKQLKSYGKQATYLCQFNAALGHYRLLGGKQHHALHDHLTGLIVRALEAAKGKPLRSFPSYSWPFDTVPCIASVALHDQVAGTDEAGPLAKAFFAWEDASGTDIRSRLPLSRVEDGTGCGNVAPRGCDLSFRLVFLSWFSPERARFLYATYAEQMWRERFVLAGFAEWPDERGHGADVDSGPIVLGIGGAASALGVGATRAGGDELRLNRLLGQANTVRAALAEQTGDGPTQRYGSIILRPGYVTGFLFGDAVLFFSLAAPVSPARLARP